MVTVGADMVDPGFPHFTGKNRSSTISSLINGTTNLQGYPKAAVRSRTCIEIANLGDGEKPKSDHLLCGYEQRGFPPKMVQKDVVFLGGTNLGM